VSEEIYFPNPIRIGENKAPAKPVKKPATPGGPDFADILSGKLPAEGLKFSTHATERLKARGISFSDAELKQLQGAVESVAVKGGKDSLIMVGDAALVVSVKNRTVVTALDRDSMKGNVFTNIDSAVII
jgi:flagellar operon protein